MASTALLPAEWAKGAEARPDGHGTSLSDLWFVGAYLGVIESEIVGGGRPREASAVSLDAQGVRVKGGGDGDAPGSCVAARTSTRLHECEIVIECIGFDRPALSEHLLGRSCMTRHGRVAHGLWTMSEPYADNQATLSPFYSYLSYASAVAKLMLRTWRGDDPLESWFRSVGEGGEPSLTAMMFEQLRIAGHTVTESLDELEKSALFDEGFGRVVNEHLHTVRCAFDARGTPEAWLAENRIGWAELQTILSARAPPLRRLAAMVVPLMYPFESALRAVEAEIKAG